MTTRADNAVAASESERQARQRAMLEVESQLWFMGRRFRRKEREGARQVDPALGLNGYAVLQTLAQRGERRQGELAEMIDLDKGGLSRAVSEVIGLGLAERVPDPDDGRAQLVRLTDLGRERTDALRRARRKRFQDRLGEWSQDDLEQLADALTRYNSVWGP